MVSGPKADSGMSFITSAISSPFCFRRGSTAWLKETPSFADEEHQHYASVSLLTLSDLPKAVRPVENESLCRLRPSIPNGRQLRPVKGVSPDKHEVPRTPQECQPLGTPASTPDEHLLTPKKAKTGQRRVKQNTTAIPS
jgi:hypothetical protein